MLLQPQLFAGQGSATPESIGAHGCLGRDTVCDAVADYLVEPVLGREVGARYVEELIQLPDVCRAARGESGPLSHSATLLPCRRFRPAGLQGNAQGGGKEGIVVCSGVPQEGTPE
jgi:hypothetical protein